MTVNLKEKTVEELKAFAYDLLVQQSMVSNNLRIVEQEINQRQQTTQVVEAE